MDFMERKEWTLRSDDAGRRLDRVLRRLLKENSQGAIEGALRKGLVRLNGKKASASCLTREGDVLSAAAFLLPESDEANFGSAPLPYDIIFKNQNLIFIDKPAGIAAHGPGSVAEFFAGQKTDSLSFVSAPLHRLDKGTSGLLAVSNSLEGARWFCQKLKDHEIKKFYWGIALGRLEREELWEDKLENSFGGEGFETSRVAEGGGQKALMAKTIATPIKRGLFCGKEISLVQYQIFTGRKRQIRAQSAFHGFPLLGDKAYGAGDGKYYLRSMRMEFPDNNLGIPSVIEAPEAQDFLAFFKD